MADVQPSRGDASAFNTFEGWAEARIDELISLLHDQNSIMTELRRRVFRLERGAGRGLMHPGDLSDRMEDGIA